MKRGEAINFGLSPLQPGGPSREELEDRKTTREGEGKKMTHALYNTI